MKLDLAKRLVNARTEKNLTQEKLSELSGVSVSEISRIENGRYSATVETLCRLSNALDVGLDSLLYFYMIFSLKIPIYKILTSKKLSLSWKLWMKSMQKT